MNHSNIHIDLLKAGESFPWELLEHADPSRHQIEKYLGASECFVAREGTGISAVLVLQRTGTDSMEIMNIAVDPAWQGKGIGRMLLEFAENITKKNNCKVLIIKTGNSSIGQLALYQKAGFEIAGIERNYFVRNYSEPIIENGIHCKHRIVLEKVLNY